MSGTEMALLGWLIYAVACGVRIQRLMRAGRNSAGGMEALRAVIEHHESLIPLGGDLRSGVAAWGEAQPRSGVSEVAAAEMRYEGEASRTEQALRNIWGLDKADRK